MTNQLLVPYQNDAVFAVEMITWLLCTWLSILVQLNTWRVAISHRNNPLCVKREINSAHSLWVVKCAESLYYINVKMFAVDVSAPGYDIPANGESFNCVATAITCYQAVCNWPKLNPIMHVVLCILWSGFFMRICLLSCLCW